MKHKQATELTLHVNTLATELTLYVPFRTKVTNFSFLPVSQQGTEKKTTKADMH